MSASLITTSFTTARVAAVGATGGAGEGWAAAAFVFGVEVAAGADFSVAGREVAGRLGLWAWAIVIAPMTQTIATIFFGLIKSTFCWERVYEAAPCVKTNFEKASPGPRGRGAASDEMRTSTLVV